MSYRVGDIVLVKFPFTNLKKAKKRPVLIIRSQNKLGDIVCLQITTNKEQTNLLKIQPSHLCHSVFEFTSYVKYDKCFTLSYEIIDKKIATITDDFLQQLQSSFCSTLFC